MISTSFSGRILKGTGIVCALVLFATGLFACGNETTTSSPPPTTQPAVYPMTLTDNADRAVTLVSEPMKIVSLLPSHTEIAFALGLGDRIVGVTDNCNYPAEAQAKPSVGGFVLNTESIVALSPDLILADISQFGSGIVDTLNNLMPQSAILVVKGTNIKSFEEVYSSIELIGQATDTGTAASQIITDMKARVKTVTDKTANLPENAKPRAVYIVWPDPIYVHGGNALGSVLIEAAGGINIFSDVVFDAVGIEDLIERNPQVVFASKGGGMGDIAYEFALNDPTLSAVEARANGKIYGMNDDLTGRPGPRLVEGLEAIAKLLHPELFP